MKTQKDNVTGIVHLRPIFHLYQFVLTLLLLNQFCVSCVLLTAGWLCYFVIREGCHSKERTCKVTRDLTLVGIWPLMV